MNSEVGPMIVKISWLSGGRAASDSTLTISSDVVASVLTFAMNLTLEILPMIRVARMKTDNINVFIALNYSKLCEMQLLFLLSKCNILIS